METRRLILEKLVTRGISATTEQEIEKACTEHGCEVAVIGQGISPKAKLRVLQLIQDHCPSAAVLGTVSSIFSTLGNSQQSIIPNLLECLGYSEFLLM
jgi:hypothetical protein